MTANPLEPVVPAQPPAADQPGANTDLHRKYGGDWQKATNGYFELNKELKKVHEAAAAVAARNQQLEAALIAAAGGGGQPNPNDPWSAVQQELGLPVDPIRKGVRTDVEAVLSEKLTELFGPLIAQAQAEEELSQTIPEFSQWKDKARAHMRDDPEVADVFNAVRERNAAAAWKYAIKEAIIAEKATPRQPETVHAGLPGGMMPQGRSAPAEGGPTQAAKEQEALAYSRAYGSSTPYLRERFKNTSVEAAVADALRQLGYQPT